MYTCIPPKSIKTFLTTTLSCGSTSVSEQQRGHKSAYRLTNGGTDLHQFCWWRRMEGQVTGRVPLGCSPTGSYHLPTCSCCSATSINVDSKNDAPKVQISFLKRSTKSARRNEFRHNIVDLRMRHAWINGWPAMLRRASSLAHTEYNKSSNFTRRDGVEHGLDFCYGSWNQIMSVDMKNKPSRAQSCRG